MFKSIFKKYIAAFLAIILVSFTLLIIIMNSIVTSYSMDVKRKLMENAAQNIIHALNSTMSIVEKDFNSLVFTGNYMIEEYLKISADNTESLIFITDAEGNILVSSDPFYASKKVSKNIMKDVFVNRDANSYTNSDLGGLYKEKNLNYIYPIVYEITGSGNDVNTQDAGVRVGAIFISSLHAADIIEQMGEALIISLLWVFAVALIAVYLISEKITEPLKEMSNAAKAFAQGKLDVRVPVRGHDEIAELAVAFNNMADSLVKAEDMRRTFLANVSHDLRTPMTTIAGFIDGILDGAIPPEKHSYYLGVIASEVRRLSRLVNSLLDISRMQAGERKFEKVSFDICEMARQIILSFEKRVDEKKLDIAFNCDDEKIYVFADRDAIYQVIYNLCDNAVKFSERSGELAINIIKKDKKILFSVRNTGSGIAKEDQPYLFDRFYKSDKSRGLDKTGVGLGLYIVKTIIDQHEERIWVESEENSYCKFVFTLREGVYIKDNNERTLK